MDGERGYATSTPRALRWLACALSLSAQVALAQTVAAPPTDPTVPAPGAAGAPAPPPPEVTQPAPAAPPATKPAPPASDATQPAPGTAPAAEPSDPTVPAPGAAPVPAAPAPAPSVPTTPAPSAPTAPAPTAPAPPVPTAQSTEPVEIAPPAAPPPPIAVGVPPAAATEDEGLDDRAPKLYLRLGGGFGVPFGADITDDYAVRGDEELRFSGVSLTTEWMGGAAVTPWLMIGLGVASDALVSGNAKSALAGKHALERSLYFAVVGAFADVYPMPPAGPHLQALLGVAQLSLADEIGRHAGTGFGVALGAGYDFAVGKRWNVGVLGRMAFSSMGMDAVGGTKPSPTVYEPSLLFTATFRPE